MDLAILSALVVIAFVLALPTLHMGIWLDEFLSVNSSTAPDVVTMIKSSFGRQDDYHPPFAYIFLFFWMKLFGTGDVAVKVPFLLFGLATIPALYWLGKTAHSARIGLLAAFFFTVSPLANFLSCQCRGYALATLLSTLCLTFFIKLQDDRTVARGKAAVAISFLGTALSAAALCYTEYVGCVMIPCLGVATLLIGARHFLRDNEPASRKKVLSMLGRCIGALTLAFALFVPWIPSVLNQTSGALYMDKMPLTRFPEVFFWNLMNLMPTHFCLGIYLLLALVMIRIGKRVLRSRKKGQENERNQENQEVHESWLSTMTHRNIDTYVILWCATIIPCCLMGYITNWWFGYFRYIYPYSPGAWVLLATALVATFWRPDRTISAASKIGLIAFLSILAAVNITWIFNFDQKPNSGLYTVAQEAKTGKFEDTALIIAPDVIGPTIGYYLPAAVRKEHTIGVFGFAKWDDPIIPMYIPDIAKDWVPDSLVPETMNKIAALRSSGYKFVALAKDSDRQIEMLSSQRMPRKKRLAELVDALNKKYKVLSSKHYDGVTEDVTVSIYDLNSSAP